MKVTDCFWEQTNIGKHTVEITIEKGDDFSTNAIKDLIGEYEYAVIKVPMKMVDFNFGLSAMGFTIIETQIHVSKKYKDFDFNAPYISVFYPDIEFEEVTTSEQLEEIICQMTSDMFSTDRIVLDAQFGTLIGMKRYQNWMKTEHEANKSRLCKILYRGKHIGFFMFRIKQNEVDVMLGGIYKKYQGYGIGILTPASLFLYAKKSNIPFKKMVTAISSNNMPVIQLYNFLNFKIDNMTYVFVKHIK